MAIGPVEWGAYPGELLEELMAVLLLQERQRASKRRPSQGDGGIDVLDRVEGGYHVFQVKGYTGTLSATRKRHIKESLDKCIREPRLDKDVVAWSLVMPMDPTSEMETWLREVTDAAPFPCNWSGKVFWDSEASKYPYVIDYFLRDGKERLEQRTKSLAALIADTDALVVPGNLIQSIQDAARLLERADPYYTYDVAISSQSPDAHRLPSGVVFSETRFDGKNFATVGVRPRFAQALEDRPITGSITLVMKDGDGQIDIADQVRSFLDYGRPLELPAGAIKSLNVSVPGGLGQVPSDLSEVMAVFTPGELTLAQRESQVRMAVRSPKGDVLAKVVLPVATVGNGERGAHLTASTVDTFLEIDLQIPAPGTGDRELDVKWSTDIASIVGREIGPISNSVGFVAHLGRPNRLDVSLTRGAKLLLAGSLDLADESPIPDRAARYLSAIAEVEGLTAVPVVVPSDFDEAALIAAQSAVSLLHGDIVTTSDVTSTLVTTDPELASRIETECEKGFTVDADAMVTIGDQRIPIGRVSTRLEDVAVITTEPVGDGTWRVTITAGRAVQSVVKGLVP